MEAGRRTIGKVLDVGCDALLQNPSLQKQVPSAVVSGCTLFKSPWARAAVSASAPAAPPRGLRRKKKRKNK